MKTRVLSICMTFMMFLLSHLTWAGNVITYTSGDRAVMDPNNPYRGFGSANFVSNRYENGIGTITFDRNITEIGNSAFFRCKLLTSIDIPSGVISIGESAFTDCYALRSIKLPDGVARIDAAAFYSCGLRTIELPSSVTNIGNLAFADLSSLTSFFCGAIIPPKVTQTTFDKTNLSMCTLYVPSGGTSAYANAEYWKDFGQIVETPRTSVLLYTSSDGNVVTPFQKDVFGANIVSNTYANGTGRITFDGEITSIGVMAFMSRGKLTSIEIPSSVTSIGGGAFMGCSLSSVFLPSSLVSIGNVAFKHCTYLQTIRIPASVTDIGDNPFSGCNSLTSLTVDSNNRIFDSRDNCNAIINTENNELVVGCRNTVIPSSVTSIANYAFQACSTLSSLVIPSSVTKIGGRVFDSCTSLVSITCGAVPPSVTMDTFAGFDQSACTLCVPAGCKTVYENTEYWKDFGNIVEITNNNIIYYTSTDGRRIVQPNDPSVFGANIISNVYENGRGVITFDGDVTSIGNSAFKGCTTLSSIEIPSSVTDIGMYAFQGCYSLTSIVIPSGVTSISALAFYGCTSLTSISVDSNNGVYDSRDNCNAVIHTETNTLILGCSSTVIPSGVISIGDHAFFFCTGLRSIEVPMGVTRIEDYAFYGCTSVTSIEISSSVTSIGINVFYGCTSLTSITIGSATPPSVSSQTFTGFDPSACTLHVPSGSELTYSSTLYWADFYNVKTYLEDRVITYTSSDGQIVTPNNPGVFGANIIGNVYENGKGSIIFDAPVTSIGYNAFGGCRTLTSITIPSSIISIDVLAFLNCSSITSIVVDSNNLVYDSRGNCNAIIETETNKLIFGCVSTVIPSTVVIIGPYAFTDCTGLTSIKIPEGVTSIGDYAFWSCTSLTSIEISSSVTSIGINVFYGCTSLTSITCGATPPTISSETFSGFDPSACTLHVPSGSDFTYARAQYWTDFCNIKAILETRVITYTSSDGQIVTPYDTGVFGATIIGNVYENGKGYIFFDAPVTSIGNYAFSSCTTLTSIDIPSSVTQIGNRAFEGCIFLTSIVIPSRVTYINEFAFYGCTSLISICVDGNNNVYDSRNNCNAIIHTETNTLIFGCSTTVIPSSVICIGDYAFYGCTGLRSIEVPVGVTRIGDYAFSGCISLTSIVISSSITYIGINVFYGCTSLTSITIGATPPSVSSQTFSGFDPSACILHVPSGCDFTYAMTQYWADFCNIKAILENRVITYTSSDGQIVTPNDPGVFGANIIGNVYENGKGYIIFDAPVTSIGYNAFGGCRTLTSIIIPYSVISIDVFAFLGCSSITSIIVDSNNPVYDSRGNCNAIIETETNTLIFGCVSTVIPSTVVIIGPYAFTDCTGLTSIKIPEGVTSIGDYAFNYCISLTSIEISSSVTYIGINVFFACVSLTSITIGTATPPTISSGTFTGFDPSSCTLHLPSGSESTYAGAPYWGDFINFKDSHDKYVITYISRDGQVVTPYNEGAFGANIISNVYENGQGTITFDGEITNIKNKAFQRCSSLTSIVIPSSVTSIGTYAFSECSSLTSIVIPSSVTSIGDYAFANCSSLTSIEIPSSVTSIEGSAFSGCSSLTSIIVDKDNRVYDSRNDCNAIIETSTNTLIAGCQSSVIPSSVTSIGEGAFQRCSSLTSIAIPTSVTSIGDFAFMGCSSLTSIEIPTSVTSIGDGAFDGCKSLTSIEIPSSVTYIGYYAFQSCSSLTSIEIPSSVTSIGDYAFGWCESMYSVVLPASIKFLGDGVFFCCSSLAVVYSYAPQPISISSGVFYGTVKRELYVPFASIQAYSSTLYWQDFSHIYPIDSSYDIADNVSSFVQIEDINCDNLTYTRTFNNTKWQALYVPFAMNYDDWRDDFDVARINNMNQYDTDGDNKPDLTVMEIFRMETGESVEPNTPYLIRAKEEGVKVITLADVTLWQTQELTYDVTSWMLKFDFTGTYHQIPGSEMLTNGYYAMGDGLLRQAADENAGLGAFRWYMKVTDRNGNPQKLGQVRIKEYGEDISDLGLATLITEDDVYSLSGTKLPSSTKGLQIKQGKVVFMR